MILPILKDAFENKNKSNIQITKKAKVLGYANAQDKVTIQDFNGNVRTVATGGRSIFVGDFVAWTNIAGEDVITGGTTAQIGTIKIVDV